MRLSHVTLQASDIPRSRAFYIALGFEILVDEAHYCRFLTRIDEGPGDETLSIEKHAGAIQPAAQLGLEFPTPAALDAYAAVLRLKGVAVAEGPIDRSWLWRDARVFDPDFHEWMLFFAGKNKLDPPWRVKRSG
jgi:catechol 2,3-dioxygenase-like lactoylglutathione lyase family enzyme